MQIIEKKDLRSYLKNLTVTRPVSSIQNHHTYLPDYKSWSKKPDHMYWLMSMQAHHMIKNGWSDIAQHITTFPDGKIGLGRSFDEDPAGIAGQNKGAVCLEHLGNFDRGQDKMTIEQRETIIHVNAALCERFGKMKIVYHHFYANKSCPGTNFFGGNNPAELNAYFLPLVNDEYLSFKLKRRPVRVDSLNVRLGPGKDYTKLREVKNGHVVTVYENQKGWVAIDKSKTQWVSGAFLGAEI